MYMKPTLFTAAALSAFAAADFLVITDYPQALQTLSPEQANAWISSNLPGIQAEIASLATDTSYLNAATSVIPELRGFVATATHSIPPAVTALDAFTIFTSPPEWYTQLPSGVKSFYDDAAERVESYVKENAPRPANVTTSAASSASLNATASLTPSASASGSDLPESTGAAGAVEVGVLGAGVVAGVLGVVML